MSTTHLTDDEIAYYTWPLTQGAARCKYLEREYHVLVRRRPNGQPIVGRAEMEAALLSRGRVVPAPTSNGGTIVRPDWNALREKQQPRRA